MKTRTIFSVILALALLMNSAGTVFAEGSPDPEAVSTAFTYQGHLRQSGELYNGTCDMQFSLYSALTAGTQVGSTLTQSNVTVGNGLFTVSLDFGNGVFAGNPRWLQIAVRCPAGSGTYTTMTPRQALASAPYAVYAGGAAWSGLTGIPSGFADGVDDVGAGVIYTAGDGLILTGNEFSLDEAFIGDVVSTTIVENSDWFATSIISETIINNPEWFSTIVSNTIIENTYLYSDTFQLSITGECPAGSSIRQVNEDGTVVCEADDDTNTTYTAGTGLSLSGTQFSVTGAPWSGLTGVPAGFADGVDNDTNTTYTAGTGLALSGTQFSLDDVYVGDVISETIVNNQQWFSTIVSNTIISNTYLYSDTFQLSITGECPVGSAIRQVNEDGTVVCEVDDDTNTTYTAGTGLSLSGTQFSVNTSTTQSRVSGTCAAGSSIRGIAADGTVTCEADDLGETHYDNVVVVAKSGGDFTTIQGAINSITDASSTNRYLVWIAPGIYDEKVLAKNYIDLRGANRESVVIRSNGGSSLSNAATVTTSGGRIEISDLTIASSVISPAAYNYIGVRCDYGVNLQNVSVTVNPYTGGGSDVEAHGIYCNSLGSSNSVDLHDVEVFVGGRSLSVGITLTGYAPDLNTSGLDVTVEATSGGTPMGINIQMLTGGGSIELNDVNIRMFGMNAIGLRSTNISTTSIYLNNSSVYVETPIPGYEYGIYAIGLGVIEIFKSDITVYAQASASGATLYGIYLDDVSSVLDSSKIEVTNPSSGTAIGIYAPTSSSGKYCNVINSAIKVYVAGGTSSTIHATDVGTGGSSNYQIRVVGTMLDGTPISAVAPVCGGNYDESFSLYTSTCP